MRKLQWSGVLLGTLFLLCLVAITVIDRSDPPHRSAPLHPPVSREKATRNPWRVGVLGDSQKGLANLRNITGKVLSQDVDLLLHTGDLVANNDRGHYRLAVRYMLKGGLLDRGYALWPGVTPGNHDIKGDPALFSLWFGSLQASFARQDIAFVLLNNAFGNPIPDPKHIEERIAAAGPHKAVVLAMHQPPFDLKGNPKPEYAAFLAWLEKSKVAYLLCGHVHTYLKKKVGDTTVIINGVGGDYDSWQLDQKVYATILDIDGTTITDRRIELEPAHEFWENVEHLAIGHVAEAYRQKPILCWLGTGLLIGVVGWGWVRLFRKPNIPQAA